MQPPNSLEQYGASRAIVTHHQTTDISALLPLENEIVARLELFPAESYSEDLLAMGSLGSVFQSEDIYSIGRLGHVEGTQATYTSRMNFSIDVTGTDDLLLGFFDNQIVGDGFNGLRMVVEMEGSVVLDERFMDASIANSFFDNQIYSLGDLSSIDGPLDVAVSWYSNMTALDGFTTRFVFGNGTLPMMSPGQFSAVPEPTSLSVLVLGTIGLCFRRKKLQIR
ncbi:MAG: PEP-CTERM sorting domain-containing protein [Pirellulaceae bacterium]